MRTRNLVLGSAASFAVAGLMLVAGPGNAQNLPRYSTPAEHAQTEALNAQQASEPGIIVATTPSDDAAYKAQLDAHNQALAQHSNAETQYNSQLQQYDAQKKDYQAKSETYQEQAARYADPPDVVVVEEHPSAVIVEHPPAAVVVEPRHVLTYPDDHPGLVPLSRLVDPDREIAGVPVEDRAGYTVGHFRHMTFQDAGEPKAVITLHNNKTVAVRDDHLRFDANHATIVADLSYDELSSMPARF